MDWSTLALEYPHRLWLLPIIAAALVVPALWGNRHDRATRTAALAVRLVCVLLVGLLIAEPVVTETDTRRFEPVQPWRLVLADAAPDPALVDFHESPEVFAARVRQALDAGVPPSRCEVFGTGAEARAAARAVASMGVPCRLVGPPPPDLSGVTAVLEAPAELQPGETWQVAARWSGEGRPVLRLADAGLAFTQQGAELRAQGPALPAGRHVLEFELQGTDGRVLQRTGRTIRVGDKPVMLLLGLEDARAAEAVALAPAFDHRRCTVRELAADQLQGAQIVLASIEALYRLDSKQAYHLAGFVARGGGLFVTGDGAKHVPPEFLPDDVIGLLPVRLLPEPKPDTPPDPPVEDRPTIEEIAKVSVCFVLDRSNSMNAAIVTRAGQTTRWQVAVKGVSDSLAKLSIDARASVMTFTLKQTWQAKPQVFLPFNQEQMSERLRKLRGDEEYDESFYNTDIYAAVKGAIDVMEKEPSAIKLIIMMTDGADRPANTAAGLRHSDLRDAAVGKGINIVAIGIGDAFADSVDGFGARQVILDLATKPEFAFMPATSEDAARAHAIFVNSVETAFKAFDDKKAREEEARRKRLQEQTDQQNEPPRIDTLQGVFALALTPLGASLLGEQSLGARPPRMAWFARNQPRAGAAVALTLVEAGDPAPAALAFGAHGLGRTAFWAAGTKVESLGEVAGWAEFPALFAAALRWLTPRPVAEPRLIGDAASTGVGILDPLEEAAYTARDAAGRDTALQLKDGRLIPQDPLASGPWEIMETVGAQSRRIGDVYVALAEQPVAAMVAVDEPAGANELVALPPVLQRRVVMARQPVLYLVLALLMLLCVERVARRRS